MAFFVFYEYYATFGYSKAVIEEKESSAINGTQAEVIQQLKMDLFELYRDPGLNVKPAQLEKRGGAYYSEAACSLINSIYNDKRDIQPVNIRNYGAIASIPDESANESGHQRRAKTNQHWRSASSSPGLVQQINSFERIAAEAVTGDYHKALVAMTINPIVPSDTIAKKYWMKCSKRIKETC
ncbi:family 4 glycosyl hydrolase [Peribacillus sp. N1]